MSRRITDEMVPRIYLGDRVAFDGPDGERLTGEVTRVYFNGVDLYVEVDGEQYEVNVTDDNVKKVK